MDKGKQVRIIAVIMMVIALTFGYWTAVHAEETEEEQTVETTTQETQETQEDDGQTIDETKQKLEEISTKVDKVDNQIASQKVDSEKIAEQAKDIEALKVDLESVKATLAEIPEVDTSRNTWGNPYEPGYTLPLNTTKRYYIYELRYKTSVGQSYFNTYYIASNSANLQLVFTKDTLNSTTSSYMGITNLYTEQNANYIQPIVGVSSSAGSMYEIKEMIINPDNWGYWKADETDTTTYKMYAGYYQRNGQTRMTRYMIVPSGYDSNPNVDYAKEYMVTGLAAISASDLSIGNATGAIQVADGVKEECTLQIIETVKPPEQPWTVEQIYTPILVIMSVLVIMLFKKH